MASLYEQFNSPITAGSPGYEQRMMADTQQNLQPQYQQAQKTLDQNMSNRGILQSGVQAQGSMNLSNDYLKQMGATAGQAAMQSANLAEQNRQRQQLLDFQQNMLSQQLGEQARQFNAQQGMAGTQYWSNMLAPLATAGGGALWNGLQSGGLMGAMGAGGAAGAGGDAAAGAGVDTALSGASLGGYGDALLAADAM